MHWVARVNNICLIDWIALLNVYIFLLLLDTGIVDIIESVTGSLIELVLVVLFCATVVVLYQRYHIRKLYLKSFKVCLNKLCAIF